MRLTFASLILNRCLSLADMPAVGALVVVKYKGRKVWLERIKEKDPPGSFSSRPKDSVKSAYM